MTRNAITTRQLQQGIEDARQAASRLRWNQFFGRAQGRAAGSNRASNRDPVLREGPKAVRGDSA